jgi:hypothetical protein
MKQVGDQQTAFITHSLPIVASKPTLFTQFGVFFCPSYIPDDPRLGGLDHEHGCLLSDGP